MAPVVISSACSLASRRMQPDNTPVGSPKFVASKCGGGGAHTAPSAGAPSTPPPSADPAAVMRVSAVLAPAEVYAAAVDSVAAKDALPLPKLLLMGISSGM